jgi:Transposase DDE domain
LNIAGSFARWQFRSPRPRSGGFQPNGTCFTLKPRKRKESRHSAQVLRQAYGFLEGSQSDMVLRQKVPLDAENDARFDKAFERLSKLLDLRVADQLHPVGHNAVYTTSVVLWMLVYQRMNPDASLEAAVKELIRTKPDLLPDNKRVREGSLSANTSTYSQARSNMPREAAEWLARQVSQSLIDATPPTLGQRRVFMIDGTTINLAPEPGLRKAFPPATNQHGPGVWPVALLTVAHELASGVALIPEVGAMYGENAVSETALVRNLLRQMPAGSVAMADSGFGIFAVAHEVSSAGHAFVLRMTTQRFNALKRQARVVTTSDQAKVWSLVWRPSASERKKHPDLPQDAAMEVQLHEIVIHEDLTLYLVSDLTSDSIVLANLYKQRVDVETDIRNFKVVLNAEHIRAKSVEMFFKELLASVVSYNLVSQFRRQAAELVNEPPRRMSFKRIWTTFRVFLLSEMQKDAASWRNQYRIALQYAMMDKLPNRPGRKFEREAYRKTHKSNGFKKRKPKSPT